MKKWIALLMTLCLALSLCACVVTTPLPEDQLPEKPEQNASDLPLATKSFTVIVVHADGSEKTFTYETAEEFVGPVLTADGLIQGNAGPYGMEITHVDGYVTSYSSLEAPAAVAVGDTVTLGQAIGTVGNTALLETATGDHLHFSVSCNGVVMDPELFFQLG